MHAVRIAKEAVKNGKCVVIGVQLTGEANTLEQMEKEGGGLSDFVSTTKNILLSLVNRHFSVPGYYDGTVGGKRKPYYEVDGKFKRKKSESTEYYDASDLESEEWNEDAKNDRESLPSIRNQLFALIEKLGALLPRNWMDYLINELGGPQNVAEISNREARVVQKDNGQADRRVINQRRRVYILLQCPSSADLAIHQFGCVHRSNQVTAPEFIILFSELAGERRFASIVAKHLEHFGATNSGDRHVIEPVDPSEFSIDDQHGWLALESTMRSILGYKEPVVPPPADYLGDFCKGLHYNNISEALFSVGLIKNCAFGSDWAPNAFPPPYNTHLPKFLNRILGVPVELQTRLYKYFTDTLSMTIHYAKTRSDFSAMGIVDIGEGKYNHRTKLQIFTTDIATGSAAKIELHRFEFDWGMSWETAQEKWNSITGANEGFYLSNEFLNGKCGVSLIEKSDIPVSADRCDQKEFLYKVFRPNTGLQMMSQSLADRKKKLRKVTPVDARQYWDDLYFASQTDCYHSYWYGRCAKKAMGLECRKGLRLQTYNILCGPVLSIWKDVETIVLNANGTMQVACVHVGGKRTVGLIIPTICESSISNLLTKHCGRGKF
ncbi:hypothetical protein DAPPUDRAFT_302026 [Daphnia pulex]|uniref:Uncharacterized protein n=1 Tax=Daphnia pulex TaxID=6669 RepID=E9HLM0_DAPPU|nr:hypothetical protein DAPPUDRAFT_302026 [Daphnia pulex]|eukprot:EFX67393.1 hypothetical protein DAPPUDRAFT_302026 [Daphnia pulex]